MSESLIREASSREMHEIELVAALDARLAAGGQYLQPRLRSIPNGWRDYRMIASRVGRLIEALYQTLPNSQLRHMVTLAQYGEAVVRVKGPADKPMQAVLLSDLEVLIDTLMGAHCSMCLKDGPDVKRCQLRKAMMNIATPPNVQTAMCPFSQVALENHDGNYVARKRQ